MLLAIMYAFGARRWYPFKPQDDSMLHSTEHLQPLNLGEQVNTVLKDIFENKIHFNAVMGLKIDALYTTQASGHILMRPELYGHYEGQRIHGGVISATLDAMGGLAVMLGLAERFKDDPPLSLYQRFAKVGTIDLRVDYLRPGVSATRFNCSATIVRLGSRVGNTTMQFTDEEGTLIAMGTGAYIVS